MSKKRKRRHRTRPRQRKRWENSDYDWWQPYPPLRPEDRLSNLEEHNYRDLISGYDELVAEIGEEKLTEMMDYYFFFLSRSGLLIDEPEMDDVDLHLDPDDFLVYATRDFIISSMEEKLDLFDQEEGGYVKEYEHILDHAFQRYLTPPVLANLRRRLRRIVRRRRNTGIGSMADAVEIALSEQDVPLMIITLLQQLFSDALLQTVLNQREYTEQAWEERDRSLDTWMEQIAAADFDHPATEAVEKLVRAGKRAMPHVIHLFYNLELEYGDYPVSTALEIAGQIPCQLSLHILLQTLFEDIGNSSELAFDLLAEMPDLVCPYLAYALTVPGGPDWETAMFGYSLLSKLRCPEAFGLLVEGLSYQGDNAADGEAGQTYAAEGLLELGDERAIPILHDYLRDPQANTTAQGELLYMLREEDGGHPWAAQVAGDLELEAD